MSKPMEVSEVIRPENVILDLPAPSKTRLLQGLSEMAGKTLKIRDTEILVGLRNREALGSTGIGAGIAIPHAPAPGIAVPFGLFARLAHPIPFESIDDVPVDVVCLLLFPPEGRSAYLSVLACITRQLRSAGIMKKVRSARDRAELYAAITEGARQVEA